MLKFSQRIILSRAIGLIEVILCGFVTKGLMQKPNISTFKIMDVVNECATVIDINVHQNTHCHFSFISGI